MEGNRRKWKAIRELGQALRITHYALRFTFYVCFLFFTCWERTAYPQSQSHLEAIYRRANADYEQGQYQRAIEKYEQIVPLFRNGIVYYNLGNAYFRLEERGKAIVNYERAKRLMPRDKDNAFQPEARRGKERRFIASP